MRFSSGDPTYLLGHPVTMVILGVVVLTILLALRRALGDRRARMRAA